MNDTYAARVNGCAVGMVHMDKPVCKPWKIEVRHGTLLKAVLASFRCPANHEHSQIRGGTLAKQSAFYPAKLAAAFADEVCARPPMRGERLLQSTSSPSFNAIAAAEHTYLACAGSAPNVR